MRRPRPWKLLETELLQDCAVFTVSRAATLSPKDGGTRDFYRLDSRDWINIVPLTPAGEVVMIRQWRHGSRTETLEIPGGLVDPGEDPLTAASRELREETGYEAAEIVPIGTVNPNPALFGNRLHTFLGRGAVCVGDVRNDGNEETVVELVPRAELRRIVREGGVDHGLVLSALHYLDLHEEIGA